MKTIVIGYMVMSWLLIAGHQDSVRTVQLGCVKVELDSHSFVCE